MTAGQKIRQPNWVANIGIRPPTPRILRPQRGLTLRCPAHEGNAMETRVNAGLSVKIDRIVARRTEPVPGLAIAVIKNGQIVHLAGYGSADLETATPITPQP